MNEAQKWEWVALVRAVFPGQPLEDETVEQWSGQLDRWSADYAQAAVARVAETMPRWRGLHDFLEAYQLVRKEQAPPRPAGVEPTREETLEGLQRAARWLRLAVAIEAGHVEVRRTHRERTGRPYVPLIERALAELAAEGKCDPPEIPLGTDGWNGRVDGGAGGRYARARPRFAPAETDRTLEACEALLPPQLEGETLASFTAGLMPAMPRITAADVAREATRHRNPRGRPKPAAVPAILAAARRSAGASPAADWGIA
jgi:hypothetical protein